MRQARRPPAVPPTPVRPRLHPALAVLWRGPATAQVGSRSGSGVVLEGLSPGQAAVLRRLDGSLDRAGLERLAEAHEPGDPRLASEAVDELLAALESGGVLLRGPGDGRALAAVPLATRDRLGPDAAERSLGYAGGDCTGVGAGDGAALLARRATRRVCLIGVGRVADLLAEDLRGSGLAGLDRASADGLWQVLDDGVPDLAVVVAGPGADPRDLLPLHEALVDHLCVDVEPHRCVIGPLVRPGLTACRTCLDLDRSDVDPGWPVLRAQVLGRAAPSTDSSLAPLAAATAALEVLTVLDGRRTPLTEGGTLEVGLPHGAALHRTWRAHDACPCGAGSTHRQGAGTAGR